MEKVDELCACNDPTLMCCMCRSLLQDPLLLSCLHNCCRLCFNKAPSTCIDVTCGTCGETTKAGAEQPNAFIEQQVWIFRAMSEKKCDVCKSRDSDRDALSCCPSCRLLLCEGCAAYHATFQNGHQTFSLEELESFEKCPQSSVAPCIIHNKPLEIFCLSCGKTKCVVCWVQCHQDRHDMRAIGGDSFDEFAEKVATFMTSRSDELFQKFKELTKPQSVLNELGRSRSNHLKEIHRRKLFIIETVENVYKEIKLATNEAYDNLQKEALDANLRADRIQSGLETAECYIKKLVKSKREHAIVVQYKAVRDCLDTLSVEVDSLRSTVASIGALSNITSSLPGNMKDLIEEWIGKPPVLQADAPLPRSFIFGAASATVQLPSDCTDVALTKNERLLVAAGQQGLIEFSLSGRELSRWLSPKWCNVEHDYVQSVVALIDGRAAAALYQSKLIVLLRRNDEDVNGDAEGDPWILDSKIEQIQFSPGCLAVHGDVLTVSEWCGDRLLSNNFGESSITQPLGQRLQLISVNREQRLSSTLSREYQIGSLAVTSQMVVTASSHNVREFQFVMAYVIDAFSLVNDLEHLWRYKLSSLEIQKVLGICADSTGSVLYAAVRCSSPSGSRVATHSLVNGSELRRVPITFDGYFLPIRIALSDKRATEQQSSNESDRLCIVAALCGHRQTTDYRTVTVYRSI